MKKNQEKKEEKQNNNKIADTHVEDKQIVITISSGILTSQSLPEDQSNCLQPCSNAEADTRKFLNVESCTKAGSRVNVRSTDTDVPDHILILYLRYACDRALDCIWG